jgi:hypothetical protein
VIVAVSTLEDVMKVLGCIWAILSLDVRSVSDAHGRRRERRGIFNDFAIQ